MSIVFATNDSADFPGAGVTTTTSRFRSAYVTRAMSQDGIAFSQGKIASVAIPEVAGDITWIHFQYAKSLETTSSNADGFLLFKLRSGSGDTILDFDLLDGVVRCRLFGSSTLTVTVTDSFTGLGPMAVDIKIDLTSDISVQVYVDGILKYDESQAWDSSPGNPTFMLWGIKDAGTGDFVDVFQYVSELIIADENTIGMGLSELTPDATGNYSDWQGDHVETGDNDLGTGASSDTVGQKLSSDLSAFAGPSSSALRAIVVNTKASTRGGVVNDLRTFLRIASTDYNGSALGVGEGIQNHVTVWDTNPDTSNDWDSADLSGVENGVESLA